MAFPRCTLCNPLLNELFLSCRETALRLWGRHDLVGIIGKQAMQQLVVIQLNRRIGILSIVTLGLYSSPGRRKTAKSSAALIENLRMSDRFTNVPSCIK